MQWTRCKNVIRTCMRINAKRYKANVLNISNGLTRMVENPSLHCKCPRFESLVRILYDNLQNFQNVLDTVWIVTNALEHGNPFQNVVEIIQNVWFGWGYATSVSQLFIILRMAGLPDSQCLRDAAIPTSHLIIPLLHFQKDLLNANDREL